MISTVRLEQLRAHVDAGGTLSHANGCELLLLLERIAEACTKPLAGEPTQSPIVVDIRMDDSIRAFANFVATHQLWGREAHAKLGLAQLRLEEARRIMQDFVDRCDADRLGVMKIYDQCKDWLGEAIK